MVSQRMGIIPKVVIIILLLSIPVSAEVYGKVTNITAHRLYTINSIPSTTGRDILFFQIVGGSAVTVTPEYFYVSRYPTTSNPTADIAVSFPNSYSSLYIVSSNPDLSNPAFTTIPYQRTGSGLIWSTPYNGLNVECRASGTTCSVAIYNSNQQYHWAYVSFQSGCSGLCNYVARIYAGDTLLAEKYDSEVYGGVTSFYFNWWADSDILSLRIGSEDSLSANAVYSFSAPFTVTGNVDEARVLRSPESRSYTQVNFVNITLTGNITIQGDRAYANYNVSAVALDPQLPIKRVYYYFNNELLFYEDVNAMNYSATKQFDITDKTITSNVTLKVVATTSISQHEATVTIQMSNPLSISVTNYYLSYDDESEELYLNFVLNAVSSNPSYPIRFFGVYVDNQCIYSENVNTNQLSGEYSIEFPISSLPKQVTFVVKSILFSADTTKTITDVRAPVIDSLQAFVDSSGGGFLISAHDDILIKSYIVKKGGTTVKSGVINKQNISNYQIRISPSYGSGTYTVYIYDLAGNAAHGSAYLDIRISDVIELIDANTGDNLNLTDFYDLCIYFVKEKNEECFVKNGEILTILRNGRYFDLVTPLDLIYVRWRYSDEWYFIEINGSLARRIDLNEITIAIPGRVNITENNVTHLIEPPLYSTLFLSSTFRPVIVYQERIDAIVLATHTIYSYEGYKSARAYLIRDAYNVYTIDGDVLYFLVSIDGSIAGYVNLDALVYACKPTYHLYGRAISYEWVENDLLLIRLNSTSKSDLFMRVYLNDRVIFEQIAENVTAMTGLVDFSAMNVSLNNSDIITTEGYINFTLVEVINILPPIQFKIPDEIVVIVSLLLLFTGLFFLGYQSTYAFFGIAISAMVIFLTAYADEMNTNVRLIQVFAIIFIILSVVYLLRREWHEST